MTCRIILAGLVNNISNKNIQTRLIIKGFVLLKRLFTSYIKSFKKAIIAIYQIYRKHLSYTEAPSSKAVRGYVASQTENKLNSKQHPEGNHQH